jgi:hypothetical protein
MGENEISVPVSAPVFASMKGTTRSVEPSWPEELTSRLVERDRI